MPHDDFAVEPVRGLPEAPPSGERILWQGAPDTWALAKASLSVHWIGLYFAAIALWRGIAVGTELGIGPGISAALTYLAFGAAAMLVLWLMALAMARSTVYTITTERVAMRVGAALTVTLNLPYRWINSADLALKPDGTGSIHLDLKGSTKFSYLVIWPHVKPWHIGHVKPTLRALPNAREVAEILGRAAEAASPAIASELPAAAGAAQDHPHPTATAVAAE